MELRIITPEEAFLKAVEFNHEEIKQELAVRLEKYKGLQYSEEQIKDAKTDRATLNKFKSAIEDKRKEIKTKCLEPYDIFEKKIKEITALVDAPINEIDSQVKTFEQKQKDEKKELLEKSYIEIVGDMKEILPLARLWNEKWLNATYKLSEAQKEMMYAVERTKTDLNTIDQMESEFKLQVKDKYLSTGDYGEAMREKVRLEEQKKKLEAYEAEQKAKAQEAETKVEVIKEVVPNIVEVSLPKAEIVEPIEEVLETLDFRVFVTQEQKQLLKQFLIENKIKFGRVQ